MIQDAETLGLLLDSIRRFVRERLIPAEVEVTEADAMPEAIVREMREMGLFGYALPREYGGLGLTTEEQMHVSFELCYASPVFRSYVGTNNGIGGMGIVIDGTPAQKERYLRRLADAAKADGRELLVCSSRLGCACSQQKPASPSV